ncbi:hypothetical protein CMV_006283 [Castanea mollissima]|uniref:Uncharacterized protein n=1 Tax=Castanea mollissima TaxID=60419 RepID=A0A8J4RK13_9ROSI|nr:hypothetical protein CMV_006283 [Castanea mollissima]
MLEVTLIKSIFCFIFQMYFHTFEKLKIELAKVRDEFKLSDSDCGSGRAQVAQLTTKIKHLSSVLHKRVTVEPR